MKNNLIISFFIISLFLVFISCKNGNNSKVIDLEEITIEDIHNGYNTSSDG